MYARYIRSSSSASIAGGIRCTFDLYHASLARAYDVANISNFAEDGPGEGAAGGNVALELVVGAVAARLSLGEVGEGGEEADEDDEGGTIMVDDDCERVADEERSLDVTVPVRWRLSHAWAGLLPFATAARFASRASAVATYASKSAYRLVVIESPMRD